MDPSSKNFSLFIKLKGLIFSHAYHSFKIAFYVDDKVLGSYLLCAHDQDKPAIEFDLVWTGVLVLLDSAHDHLYINVFSDEGENVAYGRCDLRDPNTKKYMERPSTRLTIYQHDINGLPDMTQSVQMKLKLVVQEATDTGVARIIAHNISQNPDDSSNFTVSSTSETAVLKNPIVQRLMHERNSFYRQAQIKQVIGSACLQNFYPALRLAFNGLFDPTSRLMETPLHYSCVHHKEVSENSFVRATNNKRAVVIGLNYQEMYTTNPNCPALLGCGTDASNVHKFLKYFLGFNKVCLIGDKEGTKASILKSIQYMYKDAERGDILFFSFSGHGRYSLDGGRSRCLCTSDQDINESELYRYLIDACPEGVKLTIILDACHSGYFFNLPFRWYRPNWYTNHVVRKVKGDIVCLSGCDVYQTTQEFGGNGSINGRFSTFLIIAVIGFPSYHTYETLVRHINKSLLKMKSKTRKSDDLDVQICTMESSQPFSRNRKVNFTKGIVCPPSPSDLIVRDDIKQGDQAGLKSYELVGKCRARLSMSTCSTAAGV